jgi:hypothetical protein
MKSKLLQKKSYSLDQSDEVADGQQENIEDSSEPVEATRIRATRSTRPKMAEDQVLMKTNVHIVEYVPEGYEYPFKKGDQVLL